jgi:hypothetical protein
MVPADVTSVILSISSEDGVTPNIVADSIEV